MKKAVCAFVLSSSFLAAPVMAGSLADPVVAEPVVVEAAASSSSGMTLVLLLALLVSIPHFD